MRNRMAQLLAGELHGNQGELALTHARCRRRGIATLPPQILPKLQQRWPFTSGRSYVRGESHHVVRTAVDITEFGRAL